MNKKQLELLETSWTKIKFKRKDGTIKETTGTRNIDLIKFINGYVPSKWEQRGSAEPYFDKEDNQIKSFVIDNLISLTKN